MLETETTFDSIKPNRILNISIGWYNTLYMWNSLRIQASEHNRVHVFHGISSSGKGLCLVPVYKYGPRQTRMGVMGFDLIDLSILGR